ncbi:serine hydrolase [Asinibacterium sp. OR53]|uniref:serine hydrolase domain-containing protein n=1 Tax=Asinibacterium sp. OR53 TaxID=925409 RepID=UPI00047B665A|nr:serine hydrolase [Asinibacterium sp. OR53]
MKKILKRIVLSLMGLIAIFSAYAWISGKTYLFKAVWYNFANIDDYKIFSNTTVNTGVPQPWHNAVNYNKINYPDSLNQLMEDLGSVGLLVIRNDSVAFEKYWDGYSDSSLSGSFSMAKSITSLLIGVALKEGEIKSLQEPIGHYLPEFSIGTKARVKIIDLLTMSSGSDFDESYWNPFSVTTDLYYGSDAYKTAVNVKMVQEPGTLHRYKSGDTQLLGLILEKATGQSLGDYAAVKLWQPLGAEHPALWSTDHENGHAKAYCCFNSNTRDFARIGQLMLDSGKWKGVPVIDSDYYAASIKACGITDTHGKPCDYYGYQWWIDPLHPDIFYARGILGQYIIVIPSKKTIIVRLGKMTSMTRERTVPKEVRWLINWGLS